MTMKRYRRIAQLWNWLPAFRGVAEHQSIHKAAAVLGVSASALSRTVKLLEDELGDELFVRHPGGLRLTTLGSTLLTITRDAMRMVDDGIALHVEPPERAAIYVGVTSDLAAAVVARGLPLASAAPRVTHLLRIAEDSIDDELLQGNLDVVIAETPTTSTDLVNERLGNARASICASPEHPLARLGRPALAEELATAQFVALTTEPGAAASVPGAIVTWCNSLEVARILCESSALLCVLPDAAVPVAAASGLVKVADASASPLFLIRRKAVPTAQPSTTNGLVAALVARLRDVLG